LKLKECEKGHTTIPIGYAWDSEGWMLEAKGQTNHELQARASKPKVSQKNPHPFYAKF